MYWGSSLSICTATTEHDRLIYKLFLTVLELGSPSSKNQYTCVWWRPLFSVVTRHNLSSHSEEDMARSRCKGGQTHFSLRKIQTHSCHINISAYTRVSLYVPAVLRSMNYVHCIYVLILPMFDNTFCIYLHDTSQIQFKKFLIHIKLAMKYIIWITQLKKISNYFKHFLWKKIKLIM